jgi:hypothetical protein
VGSPFGVEIPDNFGAPESASSAGSAGAADTAPEGAANTAAESPAAVTKPESQEPQVTDLDSLERFRFQGRELSKDDLQKLLSGESGAKAESDNARFDQNFRYDLATVLEDPSKLAAFRQIYPPEYVQIVERALKAQGLTATASPSQGQPNAKQETPPADPRIARLEKIADQWEAAQKEQRVSQITQSLDKSFDKLSKKYPDADPEVINSRLFAMRQMGQELQTKDGKLREDIIEKLFKDDHTKREQAYEAKYSQKVEAQKRANSQARDVGQGGSASSPAPQRARNIKEATAQALASLGER